ncbi:MAG: patatin-like phospholipase family protein [Archangium sp.]|nr:patatin-like phospholipase family protein [Archangium sp.]
MTETVGLVLSGGGARGAYEAGILSGIAEALALKPGEPAPFHVVAGTSVGAINGAWVAANAHRGDLGVDQLLHLWRALRLEHHLRIDVMGLLGWLSPFTSLRKADDGDTHLGRSLLDPRALEGIVQTSIDWRQLHANVASGTMKAFVVAALHIGTGVTAMFAELAPGAEFRPMRHPRRVAKIGPITADHVLASAAIPALFPARRVGSSYFVDGGLRFNTPMAPAIRVGAEKLVVVTLRHDPPVAPSIDTPGDSTDAYPNPLFLAGKVLNALLLDAVSYDLQILERFNRMMDVLSVTLAPDERARVDAVLVESRGMAYRKIETLAFEPSVDIGLLAGTHLRHHLGRWDVGSVSEWLLARAASSDATWESDLAAYLLFDGTWAEALIDIGRADALAKRDEIRHFFRR